MKKLKNHLTCDDNGQRVITSFNKYHNRLESMSNRGKIVNLEGTRAVTKSRQSLV